MSPQIITLIIVLAICVAAFILLYFQGKRNMKKRDEQQAAIDQVKTQEKNRRITFSFIGKYGIFKDSDAF